MFNNFFKKSIFIFNIFVFLFFIFVNNIFAADDLQKGLVAQYPLNGTNGVKDITPNMKNGVNGGATLTTDRKGEANGAYSFNGTSNYISLPNDLGYRTQVSAFVWFKSSGSPAGGYHIIFGGQELEISVTTAGVLKTGIYTNARFASENGSGLTNGAWHLVGFTFDGTKKRAYIDGVFIAEMSVTGSLTYSFANRRMGQFGSNATYFLNGALSNARIYNRALTATEVSSMYDIYKPVISSDVSIQKGLIAYYPLSNIYGTKDATPNMNNGIATGVALTTDRKGLTDKAYNFTGTSSYVSVAHKTIQNLSSVGSISLWVKSNRAYPSNDATTAYRGIISKTSSGSLAGLAYYIDWTGTNASRTLRARISNGVAEQGFSISNFDFGSSWKHLVYIFDGSYYRLYVDGVAQTPVSQTISAQALNTTLDIGRAFKTSNSWDGQIQDIRIYNRAISVNEVKTLYDSYKPKTAIGTLNSGLILDMPLTSKYMKSPTIVSDNTPNMKDGIVYGGAIVDVDGTTFDGVNDYIARTSSINTGNNFSVFAWVKPQTATSGRNVVVSNGYPYTIDKGWLFCFQLTNSFFMSIGNDNATAGSSAGVITNNVWNHLGATTTNGGQSFKLYLNGNLISNSTGTSSARTVSYTDNTFYIGKRNSEYYKGVISGVKIYNRILSDNEVKLLYDKGR